VSLSNLSKTGDCRRLMPLYGRGNRARLASDPSFSTGSHHFTPGSQILTEKIEI